MLYGCSGCCALFLTQTQGILLMLLLISFAFLLVFVDHLPHGRSASSASPPSGEARREPGIIAPVDDA